MRATPRALSAARPTTSPLRWALKAARFERFVSISFARRDWLLLGEQRSRFPPRVSKLKLGAEVPPSPDGPLLSPLPFFSDRGQSALRQSGGLVVLRRSAV